jgi:dCTP deaminase
MILSNSEILKAIKDGFIVIDPVPKVPSLESSDSPFNTTALDLRLGKYISTPKEKSAHAFDLRKGNIVELLSTVYQNREIDPDGGFNLNPGQFAIANTLESIHLPIKPPGPCYAARIEGRSSFARCGLMVHFTAPTIHAGWEGKITLELINLGKNSICFFQGMYICQIIFEKVEGEIYFAASQFQGQSTPEGKK